MMSATMHGYLDYTLGVLLILLPFIWSFPEGIATYLPIVVGGGTIIYSLLTEYELGAIPVLSLKKHLGIDLVVGILLIISPWVFGFAEEVKWPFLVLGVLEISAALMTSKEPFYI